MKIDKELDSKLRKLLTKIEKPLKQIGVDNAYAVGSRYETYLDSVEALQLREEIIAMLNTPLKEGKYKQIDLEDAIEREKREKNQYY